MPLGKTQQKNDTWKTHLIYTPICGTLCTGCLNEIQSRDSVFLKNASDKTVAITRTGGANWNIGLPYID